MHILHFSSFFFFKQVSYLFSVMFDFGDGSLMLFCDVAVLGFRYSSESGTAEQEMIMLVNLLHSIFVEEERSDLIRVVVPV